MTRPLLPALLLVCAAACGRATEQPSSTAAPPPPTPVRDIHSYARPTETRVTHVALDLRADFIANTLSGTSTLTIVRTPGASQLVLDTRDLDVRGVDAGGKPATFKLGTVDPLLGQSLTIDLPPDATTVTVRYATKPDAAALQWLAPAQTAGKRHPFLFSQGQAILTRTWIPTQDSPGVRQTYSARITVPRELRAVMSAGVMNADGVDVDGGRQFEFVMERPIPPYLIALAIGDLQFRSLGRRTGVYAEPSVVERAASEFADTEKMVEAAEQLGGPYRWGRYDILVLPPSFPFGGMENPRLTFATPTILAGDRSLTSLIAHELAHSWSGNLVTNATWSDFWLNEGFTTYFERRIVEALYGRDQAVMLAVLGRSELAGEFERFKASPGDTVLHVDLAGRDPDDGMTEVPYEKGAAFVQMLEETVGRARFDAFLRSYFDENAFQSMTTEQFVEVVRAELIKGDAALEQQLKLDEWLYRPGLPANAPALTSTALAQTEEQARAFASGTRAAALDTNGWSTQHWQHFLGALPQTLTAAQLADLDGAFRFSTSGNSEILFAWLRIAIRHRYQPAMPPLERFLTSQGRRKFLRPLYEDLMATDWGKAEAKRIYAKARPTYHAVSINTLDAIVK